MTMNRVTHAAVRRDLARLQSALDAAPDGDRARARQLGVAYANLPRELKHHHVGEDSHVFPFVASVEETSELVLVMEAEHEAIADALASLASSGRWMAWVQDGMPHEERAYFHREVAPAWRSSA